MNRVEMKNRIAEGSPRLKAAMTGVFYLFTIIAAGIVLFVHGRLTFAVDLIAALCYLAVTALFYDLFKPASKSLSWLAASRNFVAQITAHSRRVHKEVRRTI